MDSTLELFRALAAHHVDASALLQPRTPVLQQQGLMTGGYGASGAAGWLHDVGAVPGLGAGLNAQLCHGPGDLTAQSMHVSAQYQPGLAPLGGLDNALQQLALNGHPLLLQQQQQQQQQAQQQGATPSALYQRPNGFDAAALSQLNLAAQPQQQCMVARGSPFNLSTLPAAPRDDWQAGVVSSNNVLVSSLLPSINGSAFLGLAGLPGTAQGMVLHPMQVPPLQQQQQQQQAHQQQDTVDPDLTPFGTAAAAGMVMAANGMQQQQQEQGLATSQQALLQAALSHAAAANQLVAEAATAAGISAPGLQVSGLLSSGGQVMGALQSLGSAADSQQYALPGVGSRGSMSQVPEASHLSLAGNGRASVPSPPTPAAMVTGLGQAGVPRSSSSTNTAVSSSGSSVLSTAYGGLASAPGAMGVARPGGSSLYLAHKQQQAQQRAAASAAVAKGGQVLARAAGEPLLSPGRDSSGVGVGYGAAPGAEGAPGQHRHLKNRPPQQQQQQQQAAALAAPRTTGPPPGLQQLDSASSAAGAGSHKGKGLVSTSSTNTDGGRSACPSNSTSASSSQWLNKKLNVKLYKTELCHAWEEQGNCRYGGKCQFAHGSEELRPVERHPRYKTEVCRHYMEEGACPYGVRCRFIHPTAPAGAAPAAPPAVAVPAPATPPGPAAASPPAAATQQQDVGQAADPSKVGPRRLPVFQQLQVAPGSPGLRSAAAGAGCEGLEGTGIGDDSDPFGTADSASSMACFLAANAVLESPKQYQGGMGSFDLMAAGPAGIIRPGGALSAASVGAEAAAAAQAVCERLRAESEGAVGPSRGLGWEGLWR